MVFCVRSKRQKKISITNGLPCIIYASTRNFEVGKESAQQSTKVHFDDFLSHFRCLQNELLQQSESSKVSIDNWQFLIIHKCNQIWILKLKIRSLTDTRFCFASSKIRMGYREWVNVVEKLCDCCHSQYWWPSLARITQPFYSVNSLLMTHSKQNATIGHWTRFPQKNTYVQ